MADSVTSFRVIKKRKQEDRPVSQSTWFFTVSYNRKEDDLTPEQKEWFETSMERLWSKPYALMKTAPNCKDYVDEFKHPDPKLIEKIEAEIAFESGEKKGIYHLHGRLHVMHRTKVQLNLAAIQTILREMGEAHDPEGPGLFFRAQWTKNSEQARIENYLTKHQTKTFVQ